ncbi:MAG: undecaprenyl-diphosphate phosphatase [Rhodocyclaceae bacterium]|nr:undecaprenyl-diphosphate phosphatase [Rhodocyclaceae bacterium]
MDFIQILVLAIVQGLTEFLPISSSAHLILVPELFGWPDQGVAFDVAVHIGTLAAVLLYFRDELRGLIVSGLRVFAGHWNEEAKLAWCVVVGTVPVVIFGLLCKDWISGYARHATLLACTSIFFGILLGVADRFGRGARATIGWKDAVLIGLAQAIALIPGTSRSGITITAGLALGMNRTTAARFSFLLSIPTILASATLITRDLIVSPDPVAWRELLLGAVISGVSAYLCIRFFMQLLDRTGMMPYVLYRIALGIFLLVWFGFSF